MENEKEKLDRFINAVNNDIESQVKSILEEAREEEERIITSASVKAEEVKQRHLNDNRKMTSNKYVRMISKAELEVKKEILVCREQLTAQLFEKVTNKLGEYRETADYAELLEKKISAEQSAENAKVFLAPEDMFLAEKLKKAAGGNIEIASDDSIRYGGYLILRTDKGTITDRTFDCLLEEQRNIFSSKNQFAVQEELAE